MPLNLHIIYALINNTNKIIGLKNFVKLLKHDMPIRMWHHKYDIIYLILVHAPLIDNLRNGEFTFGFFTIRKSDIFLSDYPTDLKLHSTK